MTFHDLVRGEVTFSTDVIGDPVLVRSDGRPAYNFAVVVDDALMEITHVIRGEDHISNTPRQVLLYQALGFTPPEFAHLSLVHGAGSHAAVEAARRDLGRGVPRARLSARGAGELPGADRLVARAATKSCCRFEETGAALRARGRRPQRRRVRSGEARVDEPPLHEGGGAGAPRGGERALLPRAGVSAATHRRRDGLSSTSLLPMAVGSVDRLEEIPDRLKFLFDFDPPSALAREEVASVLDEHGAREVIAALPEAIDRPLLDRDVVPRRWRIASRSGRGRRARRSSTRSAWR